MKLTITTLVIIEDTTDLSVPERSICYHSFFEDIEKAKKEIIDDVNQVYAPGKLRPSNFGHIFGDTQSQFNKLLRTQQKLRNKKK